MPGVSRIVLTAALAGCLAVLGCADQATAPHSSAGVQLNSSNAHLLSYVLRTDGEANAWLQSVYEAQPGGVALFEQRRLQGRVFGAGGPLLNPSEGDEGPAVINWSQTIVDIITGNTHVAADVNYYGDQARNEMGWQAISLTDGSQLWSGNSTAEGLGTLDGGFRTYSFTSDVQLNLDKYCGFRLQAGTTHSAWKQIRFPILITWGQAQSQFTVANATGETCPPEGGGGGGGGGPSYTCYTYAVDHYYYYPDTGEVEYRYTDYYSWCQRNGEWET